ncbi:MAG: patatin-like phospholipase family protein, partial [Micromonosporaceae bacterium]
MAPTRALVLGGGGLAGAAWQLGLVAGLADHGVQLRTADVVIGTSGGATTAVQLTGPEPTEHLFTAQLSTARSGPAPSGPAPSGLARGRGAEPASTAMRLPADFDVAAWKAGSGDPAVRARVGALALRAETPDEAYRLGLIADRLPGTAWPET